jgi:hypothetical protein
MFPISRKRTKAMPLARISVPSCLPQPRISALADAVHAGLVATCNVPDKDRFQLISVFPAGMMIIDPTFPDVSRTADASIVEILFLEGRTVEQKRRLFRTIAGLAVEAGFCGDDITIVLTENSVTDWSLGHGLAFEKHHAPMAG